MGWWEKWEKFDKSMSEPAFAIHIEWDDDKRREPPKSLFSGLRNLKKLRVQERKMLPASTKYIDADYRLIEMKDEYE